MLLFFCNLSYCFLCEANHRVKLGLGERLFFSSNLHFNNIAVFGHYKI